MKKQFKIINFILILFLIMTLTGCKKKKQVENTN